MHFEPFIFIYVCVYPLNLLQVRTWSERRHEVLVQEFRRSLQYAFTDQVIFVDESGKCGRDVRRKRGRGRRGHRPQVFYQRLPADATKRYNVVAAMTCDGLLSPFIHEGSCNSTIFLEALRTMLVRAPSSFGSLSDSLACVQYLCYTNVLFCLLNCCASMPM
jgi:DDE superfamily endonuclease